MGGLPAALRLIGIGWYVAFCIAAGVGGGVWLDDRFGLSPLLTLTGLFLGLLLAFWGGYRMLMDVLIAVGPKKKV
jgi:Putative F0F1-ATPase subunit Ca2+/Mg2+ transporter